jgi:predicted Zn-dependent protease
MVRKKGKITGEKIWFLPSKFPPLALVLLAIISTLTIFSFQGKTEDLLSKLPSPAVHALPDSLRISGNSQVSDDYFEQIKPSKLGYLIWSDFPIRVFLEKPKEDKSYSASALRFHQWTEAVREGIKQWDNYLPLEEVETKEIADIVIQYQSPPTETKLNHSTGLYDISPARSAQTRYKFYLKGENRKILSHRMTIDINPGQSQQSILAATRHELGHALGIWGHSPNQGDALYFSQVRDAPPISDRDINTLRKIYQQPTRLGWEL